MTKNIVSGEPISFEDLFDLHDIQLLQDDFAMATGVASIITHVDGTPITRPSNFCRLCKDITRNSEKGLCNCYKHDAAIGCLNTSGPTLQTCLNGGLWGAGAGISIGGNHIANWIIGQVRNETQTEEENRSYAREIGVDEEAFLEAFLEVPAMSRERFEHIAKALFTLASQLSESAYETIIQTRVIAELERTQKALTMADKITCRSPVVAFLWRNLEGWPVEYVSENVEELFGYKSKEFTSGEVSYSKLIHPQDIERVGEEVRVFSSNRESTSFAHEPYRVICKDGEHKYIDDRTYIVRDASGEITHYEGMVMDVTARISMEDEQRKMEAQLLQSRKMEAIGTLAGGIAHDFNNTLSPLVGYAELLQEDLPDDSPMQEYVGEILGAALRSKELVKQILQFSRQSDHEVAPIMLQPVVAEAIRLLRSSIPATIEIEQCIEPDCGLVIADSTHVYQIVMNLATNAYHAMEKTGGVLKVSLKRLCFESERDCFNDLTPGYYAALSISDTGVGMTKDVVDKIFDPYFTTRETGKGTGMGLSVVQGIVQSCKGDIRICTESGIGTEIHVYLPIATDKPFVPSSDRTSATPVGGSGRIMIVDDEKAIIRFEERLLRRMGYEVVSFTDSMDALEAFEANHNEFDLVITDMNMPNMNGMILSQKVKAVRANIPVIICTGFSDLLNEEKSKAMGIDEYVVKPFSKQKISEAIRKVLHKSR